MPFGTKKMTAKEIYEHLIARAEGEEKDHDEGSDKTPKGGKT